MTKKFKEHHLKPPGCVALLGYYLVMPFSNKGVYEKAVINKLKTAKGEFSLRQHEFEELRIKSFHKAVGMAALELQYSLIKAGKLKDDGVVEAYPVIHDKYMSLYLKLPATLSVHTGFHHMRTRTFHFLSATDLAFLTVQCDQVFSAQYLAMCKPADPYASAPMAPAHAENCLDMFLAENKLRRDRNVEVRMKKHQLGKEAGFMSDTISVYD